MCYATRYEWDGLRSWTNQTGSQQDADVINMFLNSLKQDIISLIILN